MLLDGYLLGSRGPAAHVWWGRARTALPRRIWVLTQYPALNRQRGLRVNHTRGQE
jgi:hypothetical protein